MPPQEGATSIETSGASPVTVPLKDNFALVLHGAKDLRLQNWHKPTSVGPDDCLIETHSIGLCGTDLHLWDHGEFADFVTKEPYVIGHESSATVLQVGSNVTHLKPGDRVCIETAIPCWKCDGCKSGRYNLCPLSNKSARGLPHFDGCIQKYYTHPAELLFKLPENVTYEEGAMGEPFSVVVHATRRVGVNIGDYVLICGAGAMGQMSLQAAKAFGAAKVAITDVNPDRLKLAKQLGADYTYQVDKETDPVKLAEEIKNDMGRAPDITMECVGFAASVNLAIYATKNGGKIALIGLGPLNVPVSLTIAAMHEIDLYGVCRFAHRDFELAVHLMATGKVNLKPLATQKFKINNALDAFKTFKSGTAKTVKVMIEY